MDLLSEAEAALSPNESSMEVCSLNNSYSAIMILSVVAIDVICENNPSYRYSSQLFLTCRRFQMELLVISF